jgi:hypothetical protein
VGGIELKAKEKKAGEVEYFKAWARNCNAEKL